MRKLLYLSLNLALLVLSITGFAQDQRISGTVTSSDGKPLSGVTVTIKGTKRSTVTNENGQYFIMAKKGDVLEFSYVGQATKEATVGNSSTVSVQLASRENVMSEVVVAMDIRRNPRELGYSVQTVKGTDIQQTQRENFLNSLQGRVAGLTITPTTGVAGSSSSIVLRGFNTLSGSNQPLFIVDGVIVDNTTFNSNSYSGSGVGLASDGANRNNDNTNRIADLNPNDIESVTVLKGPEATALYGSQASSGAIVITTKKARGTSGKVVLSYNDAFRLQWINRFAKVNNDYGPGSSNYIPAVPSSTQTGVFTSFGPPWKAGTPLFDNLHNFYKTGFSQTHNLSAEFGTKDVSFRASGQIFDDKGVIPFNEYKKYNVKLSNTTKIGKFITVTPAVAYIHSENLRPLKGTASIGGFLYDLYAWPTNLDVRNWHDDKGDKLFTFNQTNRNADYDNPIWSAKNNRQGDKLNRWIGTLGVDINPFPWLALAGRFGYDTYKDNGYVYSHPLSFVLTSAQGGSLDNYYRTYTGYNHTITATAKKNFKDFSTRLLVGTMWQDLETKQFGVYGNGMIDSIGRFNGLMYKGGAVVTGFDPDPYDSSITSPATRKRLLRNYFGLPNMNIFREIAYFAEATVGYKNYAFITYSQRFEKASPIPPKNNNYHYPGASLSLILTDMIPALKKGNVLDYAKLRASLAQTARLNDPYSNQSFFVNNNSSTVLPVTYTYGFTNANPNLFPERQKTYEVGTELRFLNSAIALEAAYYNTLCTDQIAQGYRASYATGYILNTQNAASLRNQGVEITLNLNPVRNKNFDWNVTFNFNHMWSKVLTLPASIDTFKDFYNSDTYISNVRAGLIRGHSTGTLTGSIYQRNNAGQILIDPNTGVPLNTGQSNFLIADRTPHFTLGTTNSFRYKNWNLSFLWDLKVGGDIYNLTDQLLTGLGKSERTANRSTPIVVQGVLNDAYKNTANPTVNTIAIVPQYLTSYYTSLPDEEFVQKDVNWLRLRDITLSYTFSNKILSHLKAFKSLGFFVTGTDLILITNYYGADPAINANNPGTSGVGGWGMDIGNTPAPRGINFGLKANF